jgi:hypothetical protein
MAVIGGGSTGAVLLTDVVVDNTADRLISLRRHLGNIASWTVSTGVIEKIRDGAEFIEVDVRVTGAFTGDIRLLGTGGQAIASAKVNSTTDVIVRFRISRNHQRERALSG